VGEEGRGQEAGVGRDGDRGERERVIAFIGSVGSLFMVVFCHSYPRRCALARLRKYDTEGSA